MTGAVLALALASGCTTSLARPAGWATASPGVFLEPAEGTLAFASRGIGVWRAETDPSPSSLAGSVFGDLEVPEAYSVSHVTIDRLADGSAALRAWVGKELLVERTEDATAWENSGRHLVLAESGFSGSLIGPQWVRTRLERAVDGALVLDVWETNVGLAAGAAPPIVLILPWWSERQRWQRFESWTDTRGRRPDEGTAPRGVKPPPTHPRGLAPPDNPRDDERDTVADCLREARDAGTWSLSAEELAALGGRPTRRFLTQWGDDDYRTSSRSAGLREHDFRIEKAHDLPDVVVDRFVALLILRGYRWVDPDR